MTSQSMASPDRFADESAPTSADQLDQMISQPDEHVIAAVEAMPGDFVVLGAGGKMGLHLCQMLRRSLSQLGRRDQVFAVSRFSSDHATSRFLDHDIRTIAADLSDPAVYSRLPDSPHVFFLAGVKFGTASSPDLLDRMNVQTPRLVANHFRSCKIVALSTGCVYSFTSPQSGGSTESSPTDPPGQYALSCLGREREFIEASTRHNTACTLVRLNYSVELRYGVLVDIAEKVFHGRPVNVDTGYANVIWQGDAISQIIRCMMIAQAPPAREKSVRYLLCEAPEGRVPRKRYRTLISRTTIINITGCDVLKIRDIAHRFADFFDKPAIIEGTEAPTAWLSNNARSVELFGKPPTSVDTMIRRIAKWVAAGGETLGKPTHFENRDGAY